MKLSDIEIGTIVNFLNEGGYVLDFSTADFDAFTYKSIGVHFVKHIDFQRANL